MPTRPRTMSLAPPGCTGRTPEQRRAKQFYDSAAWLKVKAVVLAEQPLCLDCPPDRKQLSNHVHHVRPLEQHPELGLVRENLVGLCRECHNRRHKGNGKRY